MPQRIRLGDLATPRPKIELIAGTPETIEARLREYVRLGSTSFVVASPGGLNAADRRRVSEQVIPASWTEAATAGHLGGG